MARFTLEEAQEMLPSVQELTAEAVAATDPLMARHDALAQDDPAREALRVEISTVVARWVEAINDLGAEVKGLWLVDFDKGDGYYCWKYPEESLEYWHGYDTGFDGRRLIEPPTLH